MLWDFIDKRSANVYGIYGHLGGGKTLTAVEIMLYSLRAGWSVTSNVLLSSDVSSRFAQYHFVDDFSSVDFWSLPSGAPRGSEDPYRSVIVVDECAEFFDQYSSSSPTVKTFMSWLRHSSKRGQLVFLIVQQPEFIAKSLRLLINKWIICQDMAQFYVPIFRFRIPGTSNLVWRRVFDRYGNLISRGFNFADKRAIGGFYDTAQSIALRGRNCDYVSSYTHKSSNYFLPLCLVLAIFNILMLFIIK